MKYSRYTGGSRVRSFRLPIEGYTSAVARVNALLDEIANEMRESDSNDVSPMVASAKTTLTNKAPSKQIDSIIYECGCSYDGGIFRRASGCKVDRVRHTGGA